MKFHGKIGAFDFSADNMDEMLEVETHADKLLEMGVTIQQLAIAKGVFAKDPVVSNNKPVASTPQSGPPSDDTPRCKHGPMKDLADKGYAKRWYCSGPKDDNKAKECWAKA